MPEEIQNAVELVLTIEQKFVIRDAQTRSLSLQAQAKQMVEQVQNIEASLRQYINDAGTKLGIDATKYSFDIDMLIFKPKD